MKTKRISRLIVLFCSMLICILANGQCNDPQLDISGDDNNTVCSGSEIQLVVLSCDGNSNYVYTWSDGSITTGVQTITVTVPTNTTSSTIDTIYSVSIQDDDLILAGTDSITITVLPEMSVSITAEDSPPLCLGNDINLTATISGGSETGFITNWTNVDIENGLMAVDTVVIAGTMYGISVEDDEGCTASVSNVSFTINPLPPPISITGDLGFCLGDAMTLNINPFDIDFNCTWTKNGNATSSDNCELTRDPIALSDEGDYIVSVTDINTLCVRQSSAVTVEVDVLILSIDPDIGPNGVCANDDPIPLNLTLNPSALDSYSLTTSPPSEAISGDEFHPQISGPGIFIVTYEGTLGHCTKSTSTTIEVKALPIVTIETILAVCNINSNIDLNDYVSANGGTFTYSDDSEFDGTFSPVDTTDNINLEFNYIFTGVNGCTVSTAGILPINPQLIATTDPAFTVCQGTETTLGVTPSGGGAGYMYTWSNPDLINNQNAQFPALLNTVSVGQHDFGLILEDVNGCITQGTQTATINPQPSVSITQDPLAFCEGESILLTATYTGGVGQPDYFWNNDNTTPDQPNTFQTGAISEVTSIPVLISFESSTGCTNASASQIANPSESPNPTIKSIPESNTVCANQVSAYFAADRKEGSLLTWSISGTTSNVDSSFIDDDTFWVYWSGDLNGDASIFLEEYLSKDCQAVEEFPVNFSNDESPPLSEIYLSELNGILYYNLSGLCYNWGYIDPNPNLGTNPPEPYINYDIDQNHYQSLIVGTLDTTLTYFCQTWSPGDCGDISGSCSNTILFDAKRNTHPSEKPKPDIEFQIFPNPNNGTFNFQFSDLTPDQIYFWELRNILGKIVEKGNFTPQNEDFTGSITTNIQADGIYLLTVFDHGEIRNVARIVIHD